LLHENDVASLRDFGAMLRGTFQQNLAAKAAVKASHARAGFGPKNLLDGDRHTFWATADGVRAAAVDFTFPSETKFNVIRLREQIELGQRIESFALDRWTGKEFETFAEGTSIGACRLIRTADDISATRIRLRIRAAASPALSDFGLFLEAK
jgi:alpha-L-fucosidase